MKDIKNFLRGNSKLKRILILALIIGLLLSGCWTVPEPPEPNRIVYRALLVGVGDYMYYSDLQSPSLNVDRMRRIFNQCKFGIEEAEFTIIDELKDLGATKEAVLNGIVSTFANADDNDISYFYWMGHGGDRYNQVYLCPTDYNGKIESSITLNDLETTLDTISGTKVVFIEACHSGNFIEKFNDKVIEVFRQSKALNKGNYKVLTSCKGSQVCWENQGKFPYGYFNMAFHRGCQGFNADIDEDGVINLLEMRDYIEDWIRLHLCSCKNQEVQMYPDNSTFPIVEY